LLRTTVSFPGALPADRVIDLLDGFPRETEAGRSATAPNRGDCPATADVRVWCQRHTGLASRCVLPSTRWATLNA